LYVWKYKDQIYVGLIFKSNSWNLIEFKLFKNYFFKSKSSFYSIFFQQNQLNFLLCPTMWAVWVGADVVKSHFFFSTSCLSLEEDSLTMTALWARMVFSSWQCWIRNDVRNNVSQFAKRLWNKKLLYLN
jgi:hypothetical protein